MIRLLAAVSVVLLCGEAQAACPDMISASELMAYTDQMVDSYTNLELSAVPLQAEAARQALPCVSEVLSPEAVSAFLLGQGLALYLADRAETAAPWFSGAFTAAPTVTLPASIAPDQSDGTPHPLRAAYEAAGAADSGRVEAPTLSIGWIQVDGARAAAFPTERPFVVQQFGGRGELLQTALVHPGEAIQLDAALVEQDTVSPEPLVVPERDSPAPVLLSSAGLAVGGGAALATWLTRQSACTLPDSNGDGYADCSTGTAAVFYGGLALSAVSGAVLATRLGQQQTAAHPFLLHVSHENIGVSCHVSF